VYWEENPTKEFFKVAGEKIYTHSIVALAFFGKDAEGKIVRHKDNDLTNNQISNLELIDREQVGERVAKAHLIQHKETKEVMTIFNWHQFESIYDVPTASTLTRLSGEWDIAYTDELGTINSIIEQEYAGD